MMGTHSDLEGKIWVILGYYGPTGAPVGRQGEWQPFRGSVEIRGGIQVVGGRSVSAAAADTLSRGEAGAAPPPWTPPGAPGGARGAAGGVAGLPQDFCRHLDDRILIDLRIKIRMGSHHGFSSIPGCPFGHKKNVWDSKTRHCAATVTS